MEREQNANLSIRHYLKLKPGSFVNIGEAEGFPVNQIPQSGNFTDAITMPISLAPATSTGGNLIFDTFINSPGEPVKADSLLEARFELIDHTSNRIMSMPATIGEFGLSDMTSTSGGREILDPRSATHTSLPNNDPVSENLGG